jgi:Asp-tRNA(Asn)/Glu-tRNA(Gln) amidotransferase A subunit family amidase
MGFDRAGWYSYDQLDMRGTSATKILPEYQAIAVGDIVPTSPTVAFRMGARLADPVSMYLSDACTLPVNMAGLPGVSIPCGLSEGLPVGLQLIGAAWSEASLFGLARGYEAITADAEWRSLEPAELAAAADPATPTPSERMSALAGAAAV